jgi:hypothetical protein
MSSKPKMLRMAKLETRLDQWRDTSRHVERGLGERIKELDSRIIALAGVRLPERVRTIEARLTMLDGLLHDRVVSMAHEPTPLPPGTIDEAATWPRTKEAEELVAQNAARMRVGGVSGAAARAAAEPDLLAGCKSALCAIGQDLAAENAGLRQDVAEVDRLRARLKEANVEREK